MIAFFVNQDWTLIALFWLSENCPPPPQKFASWKIAPQKISPYENTHLWKFSPLKIVPLRTAPEKITREN